MSRKAQYWKVYVLFRLEVSYKHSHDVSLTGMNIMIRSASITCCDFYCFHVIVVVSFALYTCYRLFSLYFVFRCPFLLVFFLQIFPRIFVCGCCVLRLLRVSLGLPLFQG
jgi:hypothetical protein